MKAALAAAGILAAVIWAAPAVPSRPDGWQQIGTAPSRYILRLENVSGATETPKLVPPAGSTVIVQATGGSLAGNRMTWSVAGSSAWTPAASAEARSGCISIVRPFEAASPVPSSSSFALSGTGRWFDMASSYAAGSSGTDAVATSAFGAGSPAVWTASGAPISVRVLPGWTVESPDSSVLVQQTETYSVDLLVTWH